MNILMGKFDVPDAVELPAGLEDGAACDLVPSILDEPIAPVVDVDVGADETVFDEDAFMKALEEELSDVVSDDPDPLHPDVPEPSPPVAVIDDIEAFSGWTELKGGMFGVCRMTPKKSGLYGAYQAACKLHKKSDSTACKRSFPILGPTREDLKRAILMAGWWCNLAFDCDRQRTHMKKEIRFEDIPDPDTVYALRPLELPAHGSIKTDTQLDAEAAAVLRARGRGRGRSADAKAKAAPEGKEGKGRGSGKGRGGRGRKGGKGVAKGSADDPGSDSSGSDSSNESSSSD